MIKNYKEFITELYKVSNEISSKNKKFVDVIWDDPDNSKSKSSSILLKKDLQDRELEDVRRYLPNFPDYILKSYLKGDDAKYNKFKVTLNNLQFLKDKAKEGDLYCEYCDKGPLVIYDFETKGLTPEDMTNPKHRFNGKFNKNDGATCDHKNPQSKGGDKFDYSNLAVACYNCNKLKSNMSWKNWTYYMSKNPEVFKKEWTQFYHLEPAQ